MNKSVIAGIISLIFVSVFMISFISASSQTVTLSRGMLVTVVINGLAHLFNLTSASGTQAMIIIDGYNTIMNFGVSQEVNGLNVSILSLSHNTADNSTLATISVKSINDTSSSICTSTWQCDVWSACINGFQSQTCTDINGCVSGETNTQACSSDSTNVTVSGNNNISSASNTSSNTSEISENNATVFNWIYQNFTLYLGTPITALINGNNYSLELTNATEGKGVLLLNGLLVYNISNEEKTQIGGFNLSVLNVSLGTDIGIPFAIVQVAELNDSSAVTLSDVGLSSTEPEEVNGVLVCASGCLSQNKCLPYGVRAGKNYCGPDGNLTTQLDVGGSCLNNFECSSNTCLDSKCVSYGFIQVIVDWISNQLKALFGIPG